MAHNIVLLNLGDQAAGGGLVAKSAGSLKKKYPVSKSFLFSGNKVDEVSLFSLMAKYTAKTLPLSDPELQTVRGRCASASKVMLCLHGLHNDVQSGFANDTMNHTPMAAVANYTDLARLTLSLLPLRKEPYNLALIMCYGARSQNYRLDHQGHIPAADLQTSFAYNFYKQICVARSVRMTARTGATGFDVNTGRSTVETEAAVLGRADRDDFLRAATTANAIAAYKTLNDSHNKSAFGGSLAKSQLWAAMDMKFRGHPAAVAANANEQIVKDYFAVVDAKNAFSDQIEGQDRTKYGKYVYTYSSEKGLCILSKYPAPGVVLYQGALL